MTLLLLVMWHMTHLILETQSRLDFKQKLYYLLL